jgi:D-alanyl-D-alanine carboxypeptidase (penicillin-binding protein 5/6)
MCRRRFAKSLLCTENAHTFVIHRTDRPEVIAVKHVNSRLIALLLLFCCSAVLTAAPLPVPKPPALSARAYILVDYQSGVVLGEQKADERMEPASITKLMTAYALFHELQGGKIKLSDMITISETAWRTQGSRMFVEVGKQVSVENLIQGMIVQSGNDATVALAEQVAGSEATFAELMNRYAQQLGMKNTHFVNSTGMPDPQHYTTARDIAILGSAIIREYPQYYKWYSQREFVFNGITQSNRNMLLWRDASVDGMKTGHTDSAGFCLVTSAQRDGRRLMSVVLGTNSEKARADESLALINYGFRFFETHKLYGAGQAVTEARIWKGASEKLPLGLTRDLYITLPRGQYQQLKASMKLPAKLEAPAVKGQSYGTLHIDLGDKVLMEKPLVALQDVAPGGLWQRLVDTVKMRMD